MNETQELKKLMEAMDPNYRPIVEDDQEIQLQGQLAKIIGAAKAYYEQEYEDEDEVLEMLDELYKGALGAVYGSEF